MRSAKREPRDHAAYVRDRALGLGFGAIRRIDLLRRSGVAQLAQIVF